jgi:erythromycin esterase-like protein
MGRRGEHNIGQLCRQWFETEATLVGFGTHTGTVAAATDWDGEMEIKQVRPSREDSYEGVSHQAGLERFLLDLRPDRPVREALIEPRLERFIGVIYRPETERLSHYARATLPRQFDAWIWFDETTAVTPLGPETHGERSEGEAPETYPFGL